MNPIFLNRRFRFAMAGRRNEWLPEFLLYS